MVDIKHEIEVDKNKETKIVEENFKNVTKNVLFWTKFFRNPNWYTGKDEINQIIFS